MHRLLRNSSAMLVWRVMPFHGGVWRYSCLDGRFVKGPPVFLPFPRFGPFTGRLTRRVAPSSRRRGIKLSYQCDDPGEAAGRILYFGGADDQGRARLRHFVKIGNVFEPPAARRQPRLMSPEVPRRAVVE